MLSAPGELAEAPDGNGGMYVALRESGVLARLQKEGVTGSNPNPTPTPTPTPTPNPSQDAAALRRAG